MDKNEVTKLMLQVAENLRALAESVQTMCSAVTEVMPDESKAVPVPEKQAEPAIPLEKVRGVLASKSQAGFSAEVRAIVAKYGASRLSDINPKDYAAVLKDAEEIGNE